MTDAQDAARTLARARWGPPGTRDLKRAVQTVVDRADLLDDTDRAALAAITDGGTDE